MAGGMSAFTDSRMAGMDGYPEDGPQQLTRRNGSIGPGLVSCLSRRVDMGARG
jgi:hypothetical protein